MVRGVPVLTVSGAQHLSQQTQCPMAGYCHLPQHLLSVSEVYPGSGNSSFSRSSDQLGSRCRTYVSHACGSNPFRFAVSSRLIICAARAPAIRDPANRHDFLPMTTVLIARLQMLLSSATAPSSRNTLSSTRCDSAYTMALCKAPPGGHAASCSASQVHRSSIIGFAYRFRVSVKPLPPVILVPGSLG